MRGGLHAPDPVVDSSGVISKDLAADELCQIVLVDQLLIFNCFAKNHVIIQCCAFLRPWLIEIERHGFRRASLVFLCA